MWRRTGHEDPPGVKVPRGSGQDSDESRVLTLWDPGEERSRESVVHPGGPSDPTSTTGHRPSETQDPKELLVKPLLGTHRSPRPETKTPSLVHR